MDSPAAGVISRRASMGMSANHTTLISSRPPDILSGGIKTEATMRKLDFSSTHFTVICAYVNYCSISSTDNTTYNNTTVTSSFNCLQKEYISIL